MTNQPEQEKKVIVIVECVNCKDTREVKAGEVPQGEMPMCEKCFNPMIAKRSEYRV